MSIKQLIPEDFSKLEDFFANATTSDDHRSDSFTRIKYALQNDCYYRCFVNEIDGEIVSACFMKELLEQKTQVLDLILARKGVSIFKNRVGDVVDYAIRFGEERGIYRFYTCLSEDMLDTVDNLKTKNLVFKWRERYDTYLDEVIPSDHFSTYYIHWYHIMNNTVRKKSKFIRHHHLKSEYLNKSL
jgi:hypothetical protein